MFTRSSSGEAQPRVNGNSGAAQQHRQPGLVEKISQQQKSPAPVEGGKSVISSDLKIIGQGGLKIISRGILQVDGEVEGDVAGKEIIIGETGQVTGTVAAERVIVRGTVLGAIRSMAVALQTSARVEGDIHHMSLVIEQGALFDGRCRRPSNASELQVDLVAYGQSDLA